MPGVAVFGSLRIAVGDDREHLPACGGQVGDQRRGSFPGDVLQDVAEDHQIIRVPLGASGQVADVGVVDVPVPVAELFLVDVGFPDFGGVHVGVFGEQDPVFPEPGADIKDARFRGEFGADGGLEDLAPVEHVGVAGGRAFAVTRGGPVYAQ